MLTLFRDDRGASQPDHARVPKPTGPTSEQCELPRSDIVAPAGLVTPAPAAQSAMNGSARRRVLIIVENLPVPFDRRVWSEASTLVRHGYQVSIICPKGPQETASLELIDGISVYRHWLPKEGRGMLGYVAEYSAALFWEFVLSL